MSILINVLLGVILSLDAFSLLVSLGSFNIKKKDAYILIGIIAFLHFIFPILGSCLGSFINIPITELKILIYFFLMLEMTLEYFKPKKLVFIATLASMIILAFSVSIDSFSIGISLLFNKRIIISSIMFSICSSLFSYLGFLFGKYLNKNIGKLACVIGIILIMIVLVCQIITA